MQMHRTDDVAEIFTAFSLANPTRQIGGKKISWETRRDISTDSHKVGFDRFHAGLLEDAFQKRGHPVSVCGFLSRKIFRRIIFVFRKKQGRVYAITRRDCIALR